MTHDALTARPPAHWIPFIFLGGMLVVVAVNAALIYFAFASWTGISTPRAFERGLGYNRVLQAAAQEEKRGWYADVELRQLSGGANGALLVRLSDHEGRPVDAVVVAELSRPLEAAPPIEVTLSSIGPGQTQAILGSRPRRGQWDIRIEASRGANAIHIHRRVFVP